MPSMTNKDCNDIKQHHKEWLKDRESEQVKTLDGLHELYCKWLYLEETDDIDTCLATLLDREVDGDPIWLQLIAASGDKKTEIFRSFSDYEKAYTLDTLTTKAFISGLTRRNKNTGELEPVAGLLFKINGKVLIIKDFTTTLGRSEEYRTEMYGQLRSIYDGYYEVGFGTLPNPVRVECKIGLLAACTPVVDRYTKLENALGTRFLKVRSETDSEKATIKALENTMQTDRIRTILRGGVSNFIKCLKSSMAFAPENLPRLSKAQKNEIIILAIYISKMRASVWGRYDHTGDLVILEAINEEKPTRVAKQLMKLAILLAIIRGHDKVEPSDINTLRRVARDTSESTRQKILDTFKSFGSWNVSLAIQDIDGITKKQGKRIHYRTAKNELEIMDTLGIVDRDEYNNYQVNESFRRIADHVYTSSSYVTSEKEEELTFISEVNVGEGIEKKKEDSHSPLISSEKKPSKGIFAEDKNKSITQGNLVNNLGSSKR
jgi:Fe2+ or Zn2+ uptake regulation protein